MIEMWRAGGGPEGYKGKKWRYCYFFGYWTGEQNDLICVKRCGTNKEAEMYLSPEGKNPISAFIKFLFLKIKALITR